MVSPWLTSWIYITFTGNIGNRGYFTVRSLAIDHPDGCRGILGNMFVFDPKLLIRHPIMASKLILGLLGAPGGYSAAEMHNVKRTKAFVDTGLGYQLIQKEKPQVCVLPLCLWQSEPPPSSRI